MLPDIETFPISATWLPIFGNRVFAYDAFLSHRWRDRDSKRLQKHLQRLGVFAWHDRDADMRNRDAEGKITRALRHSRYVVICISRDFEWSAWIRAEYLAALEAEQKAGTSRVLLAQTSPNAPIPLELAHAPRFMCHDGVKVSFDGRGFGALVKILIEGNCLSFSVQELRAQGLLLDDLEREWLLCTARRYLEEEIERAWKHLALCEAIPAGGRKETDEIMASLPSFALNTLAEAIVNVEDTDRERSSMGGSSYPLFVARNAIYHAKDRLDLQGEAGRFIRGAALYFAFSPDYDDRANALHLLLLLDEQARDNGASAHNDVLAFLCQETDMGVTRLANEWVFAHLDMSSEHDLRVACLAALLNANDFDAFEAVGVRAILPCAVRVRIATSGQPQLDEKLLSLKERLYLVRQRLEYICDALPSGCHVEIEIRELWRLLFPGYGAPNYRDLRIPLSDDAAPRSALETYLDLIELVVRRSASQQGRPLVDCEGYLFDYFLYPLLHLCADEAFRPRAEFLYREACQVMAAWFRGHAKEVPIYLQALKHVVEGDASDISSLLYAGFSECRRESSISALIGK